MGAVTLLQKWQLLQAIVADGNLSATARLVAARLLYHHNALTGLCSPSYQTLAEGTALKRRAVINAVQELEGAAWISIERVKGGAASGAARYQTNAFRIDFSRAASGSTVHGDAPLTVHDEALLRDDNSAPPCTGGVHGDAPSTVHGGAPESGKRSGKGNREVSPPNPSSFDRWWSTYPRREGKIAARKAYDRIIAKSTATADELQAGAERYAEARGGQDPQFTKMATTWLNGGCWADEPAPGRPGGLNGAGRNSGFSALAYVAERIADDE